MSGRQRIVIVEDHTIVRKAIRALLALDSNLEIVAEADNGCDAIRCVANASPDLVLMDLSMPHMSGIEAISEIKTRYPNVKVLVLTVHEDEEYILAALRGGANGYVIKDASREMLLEAIHHVLAGETHLCSPVARKMIGLLMNETKSSETLTPGDFLTRRERQVLRLIAEGQTSKGTARFLSISPKTVEKHRASLMAKLNVHSTAELMVFAMRSGIVDRCATARNTVLFAIASVTEWCDPCSWSICV